MVKKFNSNVGRTSQVQIMNSSGYKKAIAENETLKKSISEAETKLKSAGVDNYEKTYNALNENVKNYFVTPIEFKKSLNANPEYQTYLKKKAEYDSQVAEYNKHKNAWDLAEKVAWSNNPSAIFSLTWSGDVDSKLARQYYKIIKDQKKAYEEKSKWISDLKSNYGLSTKEINNLQKDLVARNIKGLKNKQSVTYDDVYDKYINKEGVKSINLNPKIKEPVMSNSLLNQSQINLNKFNEVNNYANNNVLSRVYNGNYLGMEDRTGNSSWNSDFNKGFSKAEEQKKDFYKGAWGISGEYAPKIFNAWSPVSTDQIKNFYNKTKETFPEDSYLGNKWANMKDLGNTQWNLEKQGFNWLVGEYIDAYNKVKPISDWVKLKRNQGLSSLGNYYKDIYDKSMNLGKKQFNAEKKITEYFLNDIEKKVVNIKTAGLKEWEVEKKIGNWLKDYYKNQYNRMKSLGEKQWNIERNALNYAVNKFEERNPLMGKIARKQLQIEEDGLTRLGKYYKERARKWSDLGTKQLNLEKQGLNSLGNYYQDLYNDTIALGNTQWNFEKNLAKKGLENTKRNLKQMWGTTKPVITGAYNLLPETQRFLTSPYPDKYLNLETGETNYLKDVINDYIKKQRGENINKNRVYEDNGQKYNQSQWDSRLQSERETQKEQYENIVYSNIGTDKFNLQKLRENSEITEGLLPSEGGEQVKAMQDMILIDRAFSMARKGVNVVGKQYKKIGSKYLAPEKVFDETALSGEQKYVRVKGDKTDPYDIKDYKASSSGDELVGTSAMDFKPKRSTEIKSTNEYAVEDKGLWITPQDRTNLAYLRVGNTEAEKTVYTLNPFKSEGSPNVLRIKYKDVKEIPKNVREEALKILKTKGNQQATDYINKFYQEEAEKGVAYIPFKSVKGNDELQAILPDGNYYIQDVKTKLGKLKGFDEYTIYDGEVIPIRDVKIVYKGADDLVKTSEDIRKVNLDEIKKLIKQNKEYYLNKNVKYKTPYEIVPPKIINPYYKDAVDSGTQAWKNSSNLYDPYSKYNEKASSKINGNYKYQGEESTSTGESYIDKRKYNKRKLSEERPAIRIQRKLKESPKARLAKVAKSRKQKNAWQPIMINQDGTEIYGDYFETYDGAVNEGFIATDELPNEQFKIIKTTAPESKIKKGRNARNQYKFSQRKGVFMEKKMYRSDRPRERNNFNWMKLLKAVKYRR